jgi:phage gpG-like protein
MAGGTLTLDQWAGRLDGAARRLGDLTPAMTECANIVAADLYEKMGEGVSPDGTPYLPLKAERRHGAGLLAGTPLAGTSLHASLLPGGPGHVEQVTPTSLAVGTSHPLAAVHRQGATISKPERRRGPGQPPWVFEGAGGGLVFTRRLRAHTFRLPAREFIGWSPSALEKCEEILGRYAMAPLTGDTTT